MSKSVLMLTSSYPRWEYDATTPFVHYLATDLADAGWSVTVLAPHAEGAATLEHRDGLTIRRFRYWWPESGQTVCYTGGALANLRDRPRDRVKVAPLVVAELAAASRLLRREQFDVVNAHWILPQGFAAALARPRVPVVTTVHGGDVFALQGRVLNRIKAMVLEHSAAVTVNSNATLDRVRSLTRKLPRVDTIPMPVTTPPIIARKATDQRQRWSADLVIGFVGRLVAEKGIEELLRGYSLVAKQVPASRLVIAGDGPGARFIDQLARELEIDDHVLRVGWVDHAALSTHLASLDVVVIPSRTESQGLVPLEAMAAQVPVVATNVGGLAESVLDEQTGLQVDPASPSQIAEAVLRLHQDPVLRSRLVDGGLRMVNARFSRRAALRAMDEVLRWAAGHTS